ncbi:hypothetical protein MNV49_000716 [Pseudohyphozyma bogoriensis]|nr:hypothetical protein MNV49_000716 [Pseudohyphozyma bogoriensis]
MTRSTTRTALLLTAAASVSALTAAEVGNIDHHLPLISIPRDAVFHQGKVLTTSENGVIAGVEGSSGNVSWRHKLDGATTFLCDSNLIARTSTSLSAISPSTGHFLWTVPTTAEHALCWEGDVAISSHKTVTRLDGKTGAPVWNYESAEPALSLSLTTDSSLLVYSPTTFVTLFSNGLSTPPLSHPHTSSLPILTPSAIITSTASTSITSAKSTTLKGFAEVKDVGLAHAGYFVAFEEKEGKAVVLFSEENGKVTEKWRFGDTTRDSVFASYLDPASGNAYIGLIGYSPVMALGNLQVLSLTSGPEPMILAHTFPYSPFTSGTITSFSFAALSASNTYAVKTRTVLSTDTGSVQAWEGDKLLWSKEEALGSVDKGVKPVVVQPGKKLGRGGAKFGEGWVERLGRHKDALVAFLQSSPFVKSYTTEKPQDLGATIVLPSSKYRLLIALSENGGQVLWRTLALVEGDEFKWEQSWLSEDGNIIATASVGGETHLWKIDPATGAVIETLTKSTEWKDQLVLQVSSADALPHPSLVTLVERDGDAVIGRSSAGEMWRFVPPPGGKVVAMSLQDLGAVASLGRVLGNRATLMKYLNPHLLALVVASPTGSNIVLIDASTGGVLHQINAGGEITEKSDAAVVVRDNWLIYSFRTGEVGGNTKVVSVELFEGEGRPGQPIKSLIQSFVSVEPLKIVGVTKTKLGITSLSAVFTTSNSQLVALPRKLLDPRRPLGKPSKEDQEEMLIPYEAVIVLDGRFVISHDYPILSISDLVTLPGRRESESLLLAWGDSDIFVSHLSPSRSFDVLSEGFNKAQLMITVTILTVALVVVATLAKSKKTYGEWYVAPQ